MTIGARHLRMAELSSRSGFSASTIRHYLRLGLLPEPLRTAKTMAYYGPEHLERLARIRRRLDAGATLRQLGEELVGESAPLVADDDGQLVHSTQRACVIEVARAAFLRSGFDSVSVEEVVEQARVGKAAFYRHFGGKRDLLAACFATDLDWYEATTARDKPSLDRLLRYPDLYRKRRFRDLLSLFALLRQADASRPAQDRPVEAARARLRAPLEADLGAGRTAGDARLQAEILLSVAEYVLAYAAKARSRDVPAMIRRGWTMALSGPADA